jgi:hypothetical protein
MKVVCFDLWTPFGPTPRAEVVDIGLDLKWASPFVHDLPTHQDYQTMREQLIQ